VPFDGMKGDDRALPAAPRIGPGIVALRDRLCNGPGPQIPARDKNDLYF
jgi:hypothetical protein